MATKTQAWKPRLEAIRRRNADVLSTSRVACQNGEFQHVTGHVFLEQEFLLRYVAQLESKLAEAGIDLPRPRHASAVVEAPPEATDEADADETLEAAGDE